MAFLWQYLFANAYISILKRIFQYTQCLIDEQRNEKYTNQDKDNSNGQTDDEDTELMSSKLEASSRLPSGFLFEDEIDAKEHKFNISDVCMFVECGLSAILHDKMVDRFRLCELEMWNLMTRHSKGYANMSARLKIIWLLGLFWRYAILLPYRIVLLLNSFFILVTLVHILRVMPFDTQHRLARYAVQLSFRRATGSVTTSLRFHNTEFRPIRGGICVANHTTPLDTVILSCDNVYTYIGQKHKGILGFLMAQVSKIVPCIWFERDDYRDRNIVKDRLKESVKNPTTECPVLIYPEGTCINNTAVLMFKKGTFEVCNKVYPVAIKYDSTFAELYWDRASVGFLVYTFSILTSWALVCDCYYLPPMERLVSRSMILLFFDNRTYLHSL